MFRILRCNTLFCFNSNDATRIQSLPNPFQKCRYRTDPPSSLSECLQSSLGYSPERALALCQQLKRTKPTNLDSVLAFLKSHGLSETHIKSIINRAPKLLCYGTPESSLQPKIQFLKDKGVSESVLADLMVSNPRLFTRSLEGYIKPLLDLFRSILGTDESALQLLIRSKLLFNPDILSANMSILRNRGVQSHHISKLLLRHSRALGAKSDRFNEVVEMVEGMGFKPQSSLFVQAVFTILGLSRQAWESKFKVYASLGLPAKEILPFFRRHPICMGLSVEKIRNTFDYLTKELGWDPSYISIHPTLLCYSLEKRIIPRHKFLQFLASKGLIKKKDETIVSRFRTSEKNFLQNFVRRYESDVPDILKIYEGMIESKLLNIGDGEDHDSR